ncbi:MAG: BMC domain-containing protein [Oscillospiraceae bacterium]|nr:BMC domain-containing protein [Oscillospiraceae bacterium]MCI9309000.1 BMC domain-containing protein [Oscillospiraceae bacterium]
MQKSLGLIETQGLLGGVTAADAAVKSANVELIGYELTKGGGWTTVKIQGDVGAVKAAVDAAKIAAGKVCRVVSTKVIARPAQALDRLVWTEETVGREPPEPPVDPEPPAPPEPPAGPDEPEKEAPAPSAEGVPEAQAPAVPEAAEEEPVPEPEAPVEEPETAPEVPAEPQQEAEAPEEGPDGAEEAPAGEDAPAKPKTARKAPVKKGSRRKQ